MTNDLLSKKFLLINTRLVYNSLKRAIRDFFLGCFDDDRFLFAISLPVFCMRTPL
jgi:hypothetical protein